MMDATTIKQSVQLVDLVPNLKRSGNYWVGPCPFCGGRDRFNVKVTKDGDLWICRQCGDGKYHDVIDFLKRSENRSFSDIVGNARDLPVATISRSVTYPVAELATAPGDDWQMPAIMACCEAADYLRSDNKDAVAAMRYLRDVRKLTPATLDAGTIGFNPAWRDVGNGRLAPGITIPGMVDGQLWYVQVRTTKAAQQSGKAGKYHALTGSKLGSLYNADTMIGAAAVFVVEGEFDAMVLSQYVRPDVAAVTMGSAGTLPGVAWLRYFAPVKDIILLLDNDEAGRKSLAAWQKKLPRARAAQLPDGSKDVSDYRRNGGNLVQWAGDILRHLR